MRWFVVAVALFAPLAWAGDWPAPEPSGPPVPNPLPPSSSNEFPPQGNEPKLVTRPVSKAAFFSVAGATVVVAVFAGVMTGLAQSDAHANGMSVFQVPSTQLSERAQLESELATAGWIGAGLLAVATLLLGLVTRWDQ
jgi:hypothetical protein